MDLLQEYSELKKTIDYHMDRYYNQDEPEISDYEYDKLMIRLKEIEKEHPEWVTFTFTEDWWHCKKRSRG